MQDPIQDFQLPPKEQKRRSVYRKFRMIYEYEILYLAVPHLLIIVAGVFIAVKLKTYEENKVRGSLEKHLY